MYTSAACVGEGGPLIARGRSSGRRLLLFSRVCVYVNLEEEEEEEESADLGEREEKKETHEHKRKKKERPCFSGLSGDARKRQK